MRTFFLILLLPVFSAAASCGSNRLAYYDSLLRNGRLQDAFTLVLKDLGATAEERRSIALEESSSVRDHSDFTVSRNDLQESKSLACQRAANILSKVREQKRVHQTLRQYHTEWEASTSRWSGCDVEGKNLSGPAVATSISIQCLESSGLATYVSGREIRALLFQSRAADVRRLNDEETEALLMQLRLFSDSLGTLDDSLTDSYYLPSFKRIDKDSFCQGVRYIRDTIHTRNTETTQWQKACLAGLRDRPLNASKEK